MSRRGAGPLAGALALVATLASLPTPAAASSRPAARSAATRPAAPAPFSASAWMAGGNVARGLASTAPAPMDGASVTGLASLRTTGPKTNHTNQFVQDPGFEAGPSSIYWSQASSGGFATISGTFPRSGSYSADLCGYVNCNDAVAQSFTVPERVVSATLVAWVFDFSSTSTCNDRLGVGLSNLAANDISSQNTAFFCATAAVNQWTEASVNETGYLQASSGQTRVVFASAYTQGTDTPRFFVDDYSLTITYALDPPGAPQNVDAVASGTSATVTWSAPADGGEPITSYTIKEYAATNVSDTQTDSQVVTGSPPATMATFNGLTEGTTYTFRVAATNGIGTGADGQSNSITIDSGAFTPPARMTAASTSQYRLPNSDGATWQDMDLTNLSLTVTPGADSVAVLSANADLWTWNAGYNQDIGISVSPSGYTDNIAAWKESGGFGGTFSPNAAFVQTTFNMTASTTYTVKLMWKTNRSAIGAAISAGAGPINGSFSPTRLNVMLLPASSTAVTTARSGQQYTLNSSDGGTWVDMDPTNLSTVVTPSVDSMAVVSGNADLWTANAGYNQDLGIAVSGGVFPTVTDQPEAWKESGGFAGTFSPNAAFVQAVLPLTHGVAYTFKLQWKANRPAAGSTLYAGAGTNPNFSPTSLIVRLVPTSSATVTSATSLQQYLLSNNDGSTWAPMDATNLSVTFTPTGSCVAVVSANADLWTANTGFNQDIGVEVNGGAYPTNVVQPEAWKESGGFAGTYSPNAAYLQTVLPVAASTQYTVTLEWKANKPASGATIYTGAGPVNGNFSPTSVTVELVGC